MSRPILASPRTHPLRVLAVLPLLAAAACGGGSSGSAGGGGSVAGSGSVAASGPADAQTAEVKGTSSLTFSPATVNAKVGTLELTLGNEGGTPHNLQFDDPGRPKIGLVGGNQTKRATYRFDRPGTYGFVCTIHPGMAGKVIVS